MSIFSKRDQKLIDQMVFNPEASCSHDMMRRCLMWRDEYPPDNLSNEGVEIIYDLCVARSFIHEGKPFSDHFLGIEAGAWLENLWNKAIEENIAWPGMRRLEISEAEREMWRVWLKEDDDWAKEEGEKYSREFPD